MTEEMSTESVENRIALWTILTKKYGEPIGVGRSRAAFRSKSVVFKIPINGQGFHDNAWEARNYQKRTEKSLPMAKCRIIDINDIPILAMELVEYIPYNESPKWADWVDCRQVGKNKKGEVVAYDYA